jgi:poly(beta-D-mannuronate) lyase
MNAIVRHAGAISSSLVRLLPFYAAPVSAAEHRVSSVADIARLGETLRPGDVIVMSDGAWTDQRIVLRANGTAEQPVTLRAGTPGKVVLGGESSLLMEGTHLVASGLHFKDSTAKGDAVKLAGSHCRLTESAVTGGACKFFVHVFGKENRVDHCYLADKTSDSPAMQIEAEGEPNRHRIDHNHFGPRPPLGRNGGETIRVGYSGQSMSSSGTVVEQNLFDRCDGEIEVISNKSCDNIYRGNTFLECAGWLTLRHGNRCVVGGNFFLGRHKSGSGGVRVIGEDHTIINNYIDGVEDGSFRITCGIPNSPLNGYWQAKRCLIAFNTVVHARGPCVEADAGFGSSGRTLRPEDITVANNHFALPEDGVMLKGTESATFRWKGNILTSDSPVFVHDGIRRLDTALVKDADGLCRAAAESPVRGAAVGDFPDVQTDIDGQPRPDGRDVGCDQISDAPTTSHPLTAKDTGPSWLERTPASAR